MSTGEEFELSLSKKRHPAKMQYEELKVNSDDRSDLIITSLRADDNLVTPNASNDIDYSNSNSNATSTTKLKKSKSHKPKSSKKSKSKSKHKSKSKSKSKQKLRAKDDYIPQNSNYKSFDPFPERDVNFGRAQTTNNCLTKTAPSGKLNLGDHNVNTNNISDYQNGSSEIISSHHDEDKLSKLSIQHHEDASNLMFPVNPFDHLMPHKNDIGTPNMAWIGADGLVHTPQGGVYAKTTEAVANFRKSLKYDNSWHRTRQRYICLILLIMFLTVTAVVILLIARKVSILDVKLHDNIVWEMDRNCSNLTNQTKHCNLTLSPILDVNINNKNWVPATVNSWSIQHRFFCNSALSCDSGGTNIGSAVNIDDGDSEINRKNSGIVTMNDTAIIKLQACPDKSSKTIEGVVCEWKASCFGNQAPGHFMMELDVTGTLSFALQSTHEIDSKITLGIKCASGNAIVCKIDGKNVSNANAPECS